GHSLSRQFRPEMRVIQLAYWVNGLLPLPGPAGAGAELAVAVGRPRMNAPDRVTPADGLAGFLRPLDPGPAPRPRPALPAAATSVAVDSTGKVVARGTTTGAAGVGGGAPGVGGGGARGQAVGLIHTPARVAGLGFGADGTRLFATSEDVHLREFDPESGNLIHDQLVRVGKPMALAVHPAGSLVACG